MHRQSFTDTTPCVGLCSTVYGDQVCRGCKRFSQEIITWNALAQPQRAAVWQRLRQLLEPLLNERIEVLSALVLRQTLARLIPGLPEDMPVSLLAHRALLRAVDAEALTRMGLKLRADHAEIPLKRVREELDKQFFAVSQAYYQRHVLPLGEQIN